MTDHITIPRAILEQAIQALSTAENGLLWYRDTYPDAENSSDHEAMSEIKAAIEEMSAEMARPVEPAAATECDAARQASVYSTAVSLFHNLSSLDSGPRRPNETSALKAALEHVWSSAFVHGFQNGKKCAQPAPTPVQHDAPDVAALRAQRDDLLEALRKALNELPRYSFLLDAGGGVSSVRDRCGRWIEWSAAHSLFDPAVADQLLAKERAIAKAEGKEGGAG